MKGYLMKKFFNVLGLLFIMFALGVETTVLANEESTETTEYLISVAEDVVIVDDLEDLENV
jgi:hypothetical protein